MSDESRTEASPPLQRPRSPRVPVNFRVEIEGVDSGGKPFNVTAEAVRVSRAGATLITDVDVRPGTALRLTPPFGQPLDAEVNGVWTEGPDARQHIGVKLLDP